MSSLSEEQCTREANETTSPSDEIHVLGARCVEPFPPYGNVKIGAAAATIVRVTQILREVETGTRADDLIFRGQYEGWVRTYMTHVCVYKRVSGLTPILS